MSFQDAISLSIRQINETTDYLGAWPAILASKDLLPSQNSVEKWVNPK